MDFPPNRRVAHEDEETYQATLVEPDSTVQSSTLRQEHGDTSLTRGDGTSHQQVVSPFDGLDDLFGSNAFNWDEYFQNTETHQPFWQEASTQSESNERNNIDPFDALFNGGDHDHILTPEADQTASFSQLPDSGQVTYPIVDRQPANSGPVYENTDFAGFPVLNEDDGYANGRDEAYMSNQIYLPQVYSQEPFQPVARGLVLGSNHEPEEQDGNLAASSQLPSHTVSDATPANSYHHNMQGMDALLNGPGALSSEQNTNVLLHQVGAFSNGGVSMPEHRQQWQDPTMIEYHPMRNPTHSEMQVYQQQLPQNRTHQHGSSNFVDDSNGNWFDLERNLAQPNQVHPPYQAGRMLNSPLPTPHIQAPDTIADHFPQNSVFGFDMAYPDFTFDVSPQQSRKSNEPYLLHQNTPYIYDGAVPFNTNTTGHQISIDGGNTLALDRQVNSRPNPRKRLVRSDEEHEEDEDAFVDPEDEYEQFFGGYVEDGSTQAGDYNPGNQALTKRRKTTGHYTHQPGTNNSIHHRSPSLQSTGSRTEATPTIKTGTRYCKEKGLFGSESKWWSREKPQTGLQVRERESDLWRHAVRHDDIRHILFRRAGSVNQYASPRARGPDPGDETSYLPLQKYWSLENRDGWKNIYGNVLMRYERKDFRAPDAIARPRGNMMYQGRVVVDRNNRPILDWPMLPATLSTRFEGGFIEAIRRICPDINTRDFWARMPRWAKAPSPVGGYDSRPAPDISGINMRGLRFRQQNGLIAWTARSGSQALKEKVKNKMSQADKDNNTTEHVYM